MTLDLEFNDEQDMLREMVRGLCGSHAPLEVVRAMEDDPIGYPAELWTQMGQLDLIGLTLPEEHGGSGMTAIEAVVMYEELGRSLAPTPHFVSAVMSGGVIASAADETRKSAWLPAIASGESLFTTAWLEPGNGFSPEGVQLRAEPSGDGFVLDGTKWHVPFAAAADRMVVLARSGDAPDDIDLFVVGRDTEGVTLRQMFSISSDTQYEVSFSGVQVSRADRIGPPGTGWATWNEQMLDGVILIAAQAMGGAAHALEITDQYAKDRHQFDKPLGAFQALAHYLADAKTTVDGGTTLVHEAAWASSAGRDVTRLAPMAKLFACQTYRDVTAMAQQVFGGVGFTLEYEIQLYFRRAKQLQISWWDSAKCEELIAASVLDTPVLSI